MKNASCNTQNTHKYIQLFADCNMRVTPLFPGKTGEGKAPGEGWPKIPHTHKPNLKKFPANYGVVLDDNMVVVDVDPRNGGVESLHKLEKDMCIKLMDICGFVVKTGGGGDHFYFYKDPKFSITEELKDKYPGIEMKTRGRQVVGPGSVNYKTGKEYEVVKGSIIDINRIPQKMLDPYFQEKAQVLDQSTNVDDSFENIEWVRTELANFPPAIQGQRGDEQTFKAVCICKEHGLSMDVARDLMAEYNERCDPPWDLEELEYKILNGYRYSQNASGSKNSREDFDVVTEEESRDDNVGNASLNFIEELKEHWVYVLGIKRFVDLRDMMEFDAEQFDANFAQVIRKMRPSKFALASSALRKVRWPTYAPGKDVFVEDGGERKLNTWKGSGVKPKPGDASMFLEFIDYLVGEDRAWIINDFISYIVRNPGEKVLWSPLIQGAQGIGKSLLGRGMALLLGVHNVSRPTNAQMQENFTAYMKNSQLVVVEELKSDGTKTLANKLKDMITEPTIMVREMYKNSYKIINRANFIMFTNYEDAIRIDANDRRFTVIFSPAKPKSKDYYKSLVGWLDKNADVLLGYYLNEHRISGDFEPKSHAPWTEDKAELTLSSMSSLEQDIFEMIKNKDYPCDIDLVSMTVLRNEMTQLHPKLSSQKLSSALRALRIYSLPQRGLIDRKSTRFIALSRKEMFSGMKGQALANMYMTLRAKKDGNNDFGAV